MKLADEIRGIAYLVPSAAARLHEIAREVEKLQWTLDEIVADAQEDERLKHASLGTVILFPKQRS